MDDFGPEGNRLKLKIISLHYTMARLGPRPSRAPTANNDPSPTLLETNPSSTGRVTA